MPLGSPTMPATNPPVLETLALDRRARAFEAARTGVRPHLPDARQRDLVDTVLHDATRRATGPDTPALFPLPAHLPLAIHHAMAGEDESALPIAAAGILVMIGADLLDALMDDDPFTGPLTPAERVLLGAGFVGPLPSLLLGSLGGPGGSDAVRELAEAVVAMGAGQLADIQSFHEPDLDVRHAVLTAVYKSSPLVAALCRIAAQHAGGTPAQLAAASRLGAALAVADQLRGDWIDAGHGARSNDLRTGARTVPVVLSMAAGNRRSSDDPRDQQSGAERLVFEPGSGAALAAALESCRASALNAIADLQLPAASTGDLEAITYAVCDEGGG